MSLELQDRYLSSILKTIHAPQNMSNRRKDITLKSEKISDNQSK